MNPEKLAKLKKVRKVKNAQWDEENLRENDEIKASMIFTKIDEPKTPYHSHFEPSEESEQQIDQIPSLEDENQGDDDEQEDEVEEHEVVHDPEFEKKRKAHYNEFQMKNLLKRKFDDEEDEDEVDSKIEVKVKM